MHRSLKFTYLSAITTGLQAVATILSALRVITVSMRSLATVSNGNKGPEMNHKGSGLGMHKWVLAAGAAVGLITIAYLESIVNNSKKKHDTANEESTQERFETVNVNG